MATPRVIPPTFLFHFVTICGLIWILLCHYGQADEEYTAPSRRSKRAANHPEEKPYRVVTILQAPYTMETNDSYHVKYRGFRGFIPDILRELEYILDAKFEIYLVPDDKYGQRNESGQWNGMIGEVIKGETNSSIGGGADIAAAPLTITSAREEVVNFIKPFQHVGLTMIIKRPDGGLDNGEWSYSFTILRPFTAGVWIAASAGVLVVALILWANNRLNPYEWGGRHNLGRASEAQAEQFNISGSMWFTFTTLQWQGFEKAPRSLSSRTLTVFWFVFVTLTLLSYTGALINHLFWASTVHGHNPSEPAIQSLEDLLTSKTYDYGYIKGGSTGRYFTEVADGYIFERMRSYWSTERGQNALVSSAKEGIDRVMNEKYVFFAENTMARYIVGRKCELTTVGPLLAQRAYGMAIRNNMPRNQSEALHRAILELMEEGDIEALENKWWVEDGKCWVLKFAKQVARMSALYVDDPTGITMDMFVGPLIFLLIGIVLSFIVAIGEIIYYKQRGRYERSNRPGSAQLQLDDDVPS